MSRNTEFRSVDGDGVLEHLVNRGSIQRRALRSEYALIWLATLVLFGASAIIPGGLTRASVYSMLPFASILALASIGQTLVLQQRGFDFSVAGAFTFGAIYISHVTGSAGGLAGALFVLLVVAIVVGAINGLMVTQFGVAPIVATLGMNALLAGAARSYSGGSSARVAESLTSFAGGRWLGVPNLLWVAVMIVGIGAVLLRRSTIGRRLALVGAAPAAARACGIPVDLYKGGVYVGAAVAAAFAGVAYAGFVQTPGLGSGDYYLLASVTAVVVGGTPLTGGHASLVATGVAAVFLSQLNQLVRALGAPDSVQLLITGAALVAAMSVRTVAHRCRQRRPQGPGTGEHSLESSREDSDELEWHVEHPPGRAGAAPKRTLPDPAS